MLAGSSHWQHKRSFLSDTELCLRTPSLRERNEYSPIGKDNVLSYLVFSLTQPDSIECGRIKTSKAKIRRARLGKGPRVFRISFY